MNTITTENYQKGFLIDDEFLAGVTENQDQQKGFAAYVLRHTTGEYLSYQVFQQLGDATEAINQISRGWVFEQTGACGGGCGEAGGCDPSRACATQQCPAKS